MKTISLYPRAMQFAVGGYSIIPVGLDKHPLLKSWKSYQSKAADDDQIEKWWDQFPRANIGIVTGKISGITVIDIDTYKGGSAEPFPETFTVRTGNGGVHLYYKYSPGFTVSASAYSKYPGVDIRSDGGYVVGPYSITSYSDPHTHEHKGGEYTVIKNIPLAPFPAHLFPKVKVSRSILSVIGVTTGSRNDSMASVIGRLLQASKETDWESDVWPSIERINKTYSPPLPLVELRTTFDSIKSKEIERRSTLIVSPLSIDPNGGVTEEKVEVPILRNKAGTAYNNMSNVLAVLQTHPYYKGTIKYNSFRQEIEYNGKSIEDADLFKIQHFMQSHATLHNINKDAIYAAIHHYAYQNRYDEAQDWLRSLTWDKTSRLHEWVYKSTGVENDDYHAGVGSQWFMGMIRRLMIPGSTFDYVLVLVGKQGIGKTSLFRILGGPWYKSYTGAIDNKDFYLALRGAMIVDLDEGAALNRSDAIKIKSIITETHDEYRAPYDRLMKKYPRRFVFSMSTNDTEPFRDITGNRRYWTIDGARQIDFSWLEQNRDQLFAEAYEAFLTGTKLPEVPQDRAFELQETHLADDSWTDLIMEQIQKSPSYCSGNPEYFTTIIEVYKSAFGNESLERVGKGQEMRIANILKKSAGLYKRRQMVDGVRKVQWVLTPEKIEELQKNAAQDTRDTFDTYGDS